MSIQIYSDYDTFGKQTLLCNATDQLAGHIRCCGVGLIKDYTRFELPGTGGVGFQYYISSQPPYNITTKGKKNLDELYKFILEFDKQVFNTAKRQDWGIVVGYGRKETKERFELAWMHHFLPELWGRCDEMAVTNPVHSHNYEITAFYRKIQYKDNVNGGIKWVTPPNEIS